MVSEGVKMDKYQAVIIGGGPAGHTAAVMIALKTDIREVSEIIHAHPTYSEIIRSALDYALDRAVDFYL